MIRKGYNNPFLACFSFNKTKNSIKAISDNSGSSPNYQRALGERKREAFRVVSDGETSGFTSRMLNAMGNAMRIVEVMMVMTIVLMMLFR